MAEPPIASADTGPVEQDDATAIARTRRSPDESEAALRAAAADRPGDEAIEARLEQLLLTRGDAIGAAEWLRGCAARMDANPRATRLRQAAERFEQIDGRAAAALHGELARLTGERSAFLSQRRLLEALDGPRGAILALDLAVQTAEERSIKVEALRIRSAVRRDLGEEAEALTDLQRARALAPDSIDTLAALVALGEPLFEELEALLEMLPAAAPRRLDALKVLADAQEKAGLVDAARASWESLTQERPGDEEAARRLESLARRAQERTLVGPPPRPSDFGADEATPTRLDDAPLVPPAEDDEVTKLAAAGDAREPALAMPSPRSGEGDEQVPWRAPDARERAVRPSKAAPRPGLGRGRATGELRSAAQVGAKKPQLVARPPRPKPAFDALLTEARSPATEGRGELAPAAPSPSERGRRSYSTGRFRAEASLRRKIERDPLDVDAHRGLLTLSCARKERRRAALHASALVLAGDASSEERALCVESTLPAAALDADEVLLVAGEPFAHPAVHLLTAATPVLLPVLGEERRGGRAFSASMGPGAAAVAEALLGAARLLGARPPPLFLEANTGPISMAPGHPSALFIDPSCVRKAHPPPELRFAAASSLFGTLPELAIVSVLSAQELERTVAALCATVRSNAGKLDRDGLRVAKRIEKQLARYGPEKLLPFARALDHVEPCDYGTLVAAATLAADRAGLLAGGDLVAAARVLERAKRPRAALLELCRFTVSEPFLTVARRARLL